MKSDFGEYLGHPAYYHIATGKSEDLSWHYLEVYVQHKVDEYYTFTAKIYGSEFVSERICASFSVFNEITFSIMYYNIYIDGILLITQNGNAPDSTDSNVECILGAIDNSFGNYETATNNFNGWIDELRVWDIPLNSEQIRLMMNQEIQINGTAAQGSVVPINVNGLLWSNLLGYYHMTFDTCGYLEPTVGASGRLRVNWVVF